MLQEKEYITATTPQWLYNASLNKCWIFLLRLRIGPDQLAATGDN